MGRRRWTTGGLIIFQNFSHNSTSITIKEQEFGDLQNESRLSPPTTVYVARREVLEVVVVWGRSLEGGRTGIIGTVAEEEEE